MCKNQIVNERFCKLWISDFENLNNIIRTCIFDDTNLAKTRESILLGLLPLLAGGGGGGGDDESNIFGNAFGPDIFAGEEFDVQGFGNDDYEDDDYEEYEYEYDEEEEERGEEDTR